MAAMPRPRLVVTEQRPRRPILVVLGVALWLLSVVAAFFIGQYLASPDGGALRSQVSRLEQDLEAANDREALLIQRVATLERSEQVERDAVVTLQVTLSERDAEVAALRNDVAFFERLAGGGSQRKPLTVHTMTFDPLGDNGWRYVLTLTQNLKKAVISKGQFTLSVEGSDNGKLRKLSWSELMQKPDAPAQPFSFKYFQQIEGSVALPEGFIPHRVHIAIRSDQGNSEHTVPWPNSDTSGVN